MNVLLFAITVLIWGTTWIAISYQLEPVPILVSVFWRFTVAGALFVLGLMAIGRLELPKRQHQPWILGQALCLFSLNFLCFYWAEWYIPSGLVSVVFSLATIFNALNARLFFGDPITRITLAASALGVLGLILLFLPNMAPMESGETLKGVGLAFAGTYLFSLGNMVSRRNGMAGVSTLTANAWGMIYGSLILFIVIVASGTHLELPTNPVYLGALIYLAVIGSIVGFTAYLTLVARIGSTRAAYATVLFPVVALAISTFIEGYRWNATNVLGLALAMLGNLVMFSARDRPDRTNPVGAIRLKIWPAKH